MTITREALTGAIERIAAVMERDFEELNAADGALGDGDLGITLRRGMQAIVETRDTLPDDLGLALLQCAQAFTKSSGSSFGTLVATGLMSAARALKGRTSIDCGEISALVGAARDKMQARGKSEPGGKTVLDSLDYLAKALAGAPDIGAAAASAVDQALDDFRGRPSSYGRARIFGEKSVGIDDPGMLAMQRIVKAAIGRQAAAQQKKN